MLTGEITWGYDEKNFAPPHLDLVVNHYLTNLPRWIEKSIFKSLSHKLSKFPKLIITQEKSFFSGDLSKVFVFNLPLIRNLCLIALQFVLLLLVDLVVIAVVIY